MISNMTTAQYLLELIQAKNDMKEALREKGVEVWGGLNTYPDAIYQIKPMYLLDGMKLENSLWEYLPNYDFSYVADFSRMFAGCNRLTYLPRINATNSTTTSRMFYGCHTLNNIGYMNTSNVLDMKYMFYGCSSLTTIPELDAVLVKQRDGNGGTSMMFSSTSLLQNFGGLKNLHCDLDVRYCNQLTHSSLLNIINGLYDWTTNPDGVYKSDYYDVMFPGTWIAPQLNLGGTNLAKLSVDEIAIATNKGWTVL